MFIIKRKKYFSEWGEAHLAAMREGKKAGLKGKELRDWVTLNTKNVNTGGNMVSLTGQGQKSTKVGEKVNMNATQAAQNITNTQNQLVQQNQQNQIRRQAAKANAGTIGYNKGQQSVGIMGGIKNTWNKAGTMGKIGMGAAGLAAAGTMAYGLGSMIGKKKE